MSDAKEIVTRVVRPLNPKHEAKGLLAFVIDGSGNVTSHTDGEVGAVEALRVAAASLLGTVAAPKARKSKKGAA